MNQFDEAKMMYDACERLRFIDRINGIEGNMSVQQMIAKAHYRVMNTSSWHKTKQEINDDYQHKQLWNQIALNNVAYNKIILKQACQILRKSGIVFPDLKGFVSNN